MPIVVPGANGSLGKIESQLRGAAAERGGVDAEDVAVAGVAGRASAADAAELESAGTGALKVENAIDAADLLRRLAAGDVLEVAADDGCPP